MTLYCIPSNERDKFFPKVFVASQHKYIILGRSSGGSFFEKSQGCAIFLSFIAFLCDIFKKFPNFSFSHRGDTSLRGGQQEECNGNIQIMVKFYFSQELRILLVQLNLMLFVEVDQVQELLLLREKDQLQKQFVVRINIT